MTASEKGRKGEEEAAVFFRNLGYTVIEKNYRKFQGEIDLIVRKGDAVVFAEVKSWTSLGEETLEQGIPQRKRLRIVETSKCFLAEHPEFDGYSIRYDVLFVPGTGRGARHIEDAFREEG